ncbi:MAG: ABC transporter ATP-binding protein, partial [Alphaproteobacteria bacterium]
YNITVGGKYTKKQINEAISISKFDIVLSRLPKGLKTGLFEKGVNLSGGEKQRLALARGLLAAKGREIVLLDESTSSVDFENEHLIFEHIFKKFKDKFIITSIHKLNMLNYFDEIYVFDNRKIVQHGTLESLKKQPGQFQKIWKKYNKKDKKESI